MTVRLLLLCAVALLAGCAKDPESSTAASANFTVDKLFTHEGCTVYRFSDDGRYRYYSKCDASQTTMSWAESCGKNCTREVSIPTHRGLL